MKKKVRKPVENIYAHGATTPVSFGGPRGDWIYFGASVGEDDYPVVFSKKEVRKLAAWLIKAADYLDAKEKK